MSAKGFTIHVRLSNQQKQRFDQICAAYKGVSAAMVLRWLICDQIQKSDEEISRIVLSQMKGASVPATRLSPRIGGNTRRPQVS
jgi:hypothetical protein